MKTIQQYLKECDRETIANDYVYKYLFDHDLIDPKYDHIMIRDLKERTKREIYSLIDRLIGFEPEFGEDRDILLIVHYSGLNSWDDDISAELVHESEVMSGAEEIKIYDYSFTTHSKMVSFYVADTYLTQHYLNELIVSFLHEALIMGPEQEHLE